MFKTLKLKDRIVWGYSLPIFLSIIASVVVHSQTKIVAEKSYSVEKAHAAVAGVRTIENHFIRMQKAARGFFLSKEEKFFVEYDEATKNFYNASKNSDVTQIDREQDERIKQIYNIGQQIDQLYRQSIDLTRQQNVTEGLKLWRANIVPLLQKVEQILQEFDVKEAEILAQRQQIAKDNLQFLNTIVILSTILSALIALAISLLVASSITKVIKETVNSISTSSTEIAATVAQQEQMATQQAASVSQTTTSMDELNAASRVTVEQAEAAATIAQEVLILVSGNNYQDNLTIKNLNFHGCLREKVNQIANNIVRLSEQTNQISTMSTLVTDLANQTNMLALNAAVEAVRAGEYGKGFSVVATEIRKLAEQSRNSAEKINALVTDIKNSTQATVTVTDEGNKTVENIVEAINNIAINNQQISLTAKQQATAIQQVVGAMNTINQGALQTAAGISQTRETTQKLNETATKLEAVV